jgi:CTP:phosphocholine cytidylyltransferase-like protein
MVQVKKNSQKKEKNVEVVKSGLTQEDQHSMKKNNELNIRINTMKSQIIHNKIGHRCKIKSLGKLITNAESQNESPKYSWKNKNGKEMILDNERTFSSYFPKGDENEIYEFKEMLYIDISNMVNDGNDSSLVKEQPLVVKETAVTASSNSICCCDSTPPSPNFFV